MACSRANVSYWFSALYYLCPSFTRYMVAGMFSDAFCSYSFKKRHPSWQDIIHLLVAALLHASLKHPVSSVKTYTCFTRLMLRRGHGNQAVCYVIHVFISIDGNHYRAVVVQQQLQGNIVLHRLDSCYISLSFESMNEYVYNTSFYCFLLHLLYHHGR